MSVSQPLLSNSVPTSNPAEIKVVEGTVKTQTQTATATATGNQPAASSSSNTTTQVDRFDAKVENAIDAADENLAEGGAKLADSGKAIANEAGADTKEAAKQVGQAAKRTGQAIAGQGKNIAVGTAEVAKGLGGKALSGAQTIGRVAIAEPLRATGRGLAAARTNFWVPRANETVTTKWPLLVFLGSAAGLAAYALTSATVVTTVLTLPAILGTLMGASALLLGYRYLTRIFMGPAAPTGLQMDQVTPELQEAEADLSQLEMLKGRAVSKLTAYHEKTQATYMEANNARTAAEAKVRTAALALQRAKEVQTELAEIVNPVIAEKPAPAEEIITRETKTVTQATRLTASSEHTKLTGEVEGAIEGAVENKTDLTPNI